MNGQVQSLKNAAIEGSNYDRRKNMRKWDKILKTFSQNILKGIVLMETTAELIGQKDFIL